MARIRTLDFLPEIFQTPTNAQFLAATLDQLVNPPESQRIQGYIGSRLGYGINAVDSYVVEPTKTRRNYQLDPGLVFTKPNESTAQDFITYPGIIDALKISGGVTNNNDRLFNSQFYSWDSFTNLDKIINFDQYYWLPEGPPSVTVSVAPVFSSENYIVTDLASTYDIKVVGSFAGSSNPTLTLLRGGTYTFAVDQESQFWIQGEPGVSGFSPIQANQPVRDVYGVSNNGASAGLVTFNVPSKDAQAQYNFSGNNTVGVVSTLPFDQVNGVLLSELENIDGVTSLDGLTVMFYNNGVVDEIGYTSSYLAETPYDVNDDQIVAPLTLTVTSCNTTSFTTSSTIQLVVNQTITFDNPVFGGVTAGQVYFISAIPTSTTFNISEYIGGPNIVLTPDSGAMVANINQGLYQQGFYSTVAENFYLISYVGNPDNPVLRLTPAGLIPTEQKIIPQYGTEWVARPFYRDINGAINLVPYITAPLDVLYYQDGTTSSKVGVIRIIDSNTTNLLDVDTDIIGQKTFTSPNGIVFTNGLKVSFDGAVVPSRYLTGEYYVEGVGTAIELIPTTSLVCPEKFTIGEFNPWDIAPFDIGNFDIGLYIPVDPDYITIARNSINKNAWSRSNRWFHVAVIQATATYNQNPEILNVLATATNKAKRPIIEFYPNLKLFDSGTFGKPLVDFIDTRCTDALSIVAGTQSYYPDVEVYTEYTGTIGSVVSATTTTVIIPTSDITGEFQIGMYIADTTNILPTNTQITAITINGLNTELTVSWENATTLASAAAASITGSDLNINNYGLFSGARVVFSADADINVRNKIYIVDISEVTSGEPMVITLAEAEEGLRQNNDQIAILRGYTHQGTSFYYDGINWNQAQQKVTVNQAPYFDVFDANGVSLGDPEVYIGTSFSGCKLFAYGLGAGADDPVLAFPVRYSSIANVGDISFDVSLNSDTFSYVSGTEPITQQVNTGYVYSYVGRETFVRHLGWEKAIAPSTQYQVFEFGFNIFRPSTPLNTYVCDIAASPTPSLTNPGWTPVQVFVNNVYQTPDKYTVTIGNSTTKIVLNDTPTESTIIQVLIISDQVSKTAYYTIPINLNNNPLNDDITTANIGDIRLQYRDIFINAPNTTGDLFGSNNYRDLGNLVPYGTAIIQNSASLVLPGTFLRKQNYNLFDALLFNSREYIKYKQLIVDTVNNMDLVQRYLPAQLLDMALDQITDAKSQIQAFFWSDMLPVKSAFRTNTYTFANTLDTTIYPLSKVYNFQTANYDGVLVYLSRIVDNNRVQRQLIKGVDYSVSAESPSLTITLDLQPNDQITINEYNQTYGSYVPNTPTKLGMYPASIPGVVLDSDYSQPTYFIKGHDGSYTKLYGTYIPETQVLVDFRDQALLEFEKRVYNNLKLNAEVPIQRYEVIPGYFRDPTYTWNEFLEIYTPSFLNWVGQNRLNYKTQLYNKNNQYTYNYTSASNKIDKAQIDQGYWRGTYEYFYDTTTPNLTPWEMLGFVDEPSWWTERYGPAPYTSDNGILWADLEAGYVWNNGSSYIIPELARPGLSNIIPVDTAGNLLSPLISIVGNYNPNAFQKDWKVGDDGPVEFSYRRSSSFPFDVMRIFALTRPTDFFNLGVDLDNYKYNTEFEQYLVNDRSHLVVSDVEIYGDGIAKTSYINWIVDYAKQIGLNATQNIKDLLSNLDVRLIYRLAGYSDKTLLNFYVEKGTPNSRNSSLLIPDESYSVLLYDNQPFDKLMFTGIIIQQVPNGWKVYGNSQNFAYFTVLDPLDNGNYEYTAVADITVKTTASYKTTETLVPYGTMFYTAQDVSQFILSYGAWVESKGMKFAEIQNGIELNWTQMVYEFLYWAQTGWENGSVITLNPAATTLSVDTGTSIVQPLTLQQINFILNQNLYPIQSTDMSVSRVGTEFTVNALNQGDTISYAQFNFSNFEHGIVFDNVTLFNDVIYNLVTGLRQNRIKVIGTKSAAWDGTVNAYGFILNQDNITEWSREIKYTKGSIVKYKNKYWTALKIVEPAQLFNEMSWKEIDYNDIQKGMLPNASTRAYESTLYYNRDVANLEQDSNLLGYSLIGYRPRDYLALANLTDVTQVNVYQNMIRNMGTRNAVNAFKGANLPQGGIDYNVYENWAIQSGEYGGLLNENFVEFRINQTNLTGNPSIVSLTTGMPTVGSMQEVELTNLFNYGRSVTDPNILATLDPDTYNIPNSLYPTSGYANFNDVKMSSYYYAGLPRAVDQNGVVVPIQKFYVRDYMWLANFKEKWGIYSWKPVGQIIQVRSNLNGTSTITFSEPHNLTRLEPISIVNFAPNVDGYYIVADLVNLNEVIINFGGDISGQGSLQGQGIGLRFVPQRVATSADIATLDLLEAEFVKNTVWVDENNDGDWAVYRKSINYQYSTELTKTSAVAYGTAVAHSDSIGYLISDSGLGEVYRYAYDATNDIYGIDPQVLSEGTSFGSKIIHQDDIIVITKPDGAANDVWVYIYTLNNSIVSDDLLLYQKILAPFSATHWADEVALSADTNWLYIADSENTLVYVYRKDQILLDAGYFAIGETYNITEVGTTDFTAIGAIDNKVGITFVATGPGTGSGSAMQITYRQSTVINGSLYGLSNTDGFGKALSTNSTGNILAIGAPNRDYSATITDWGTTYVLQRTVQTVESQYTTVGYQPHIFQLAWTPTAGAIRTANAVTSNYIQCNATMTVFDIDTPVVFAGSNLGTTGIDPNVVYYIADIIGNTIALKTSRSTTDIVPLTNGSGLSFSVYVQVNPLYVYVNGTLVQDNNYAVIGSTLLYSGYLLAGDIVDISDNQFNVSQNFNSRFVDRTNIQFGYDIDMTRQGADILVGSPFEIDTKNREGAVYRYTNGGARYGLVIGSTACTVLGPRNLLINGYLVQLNAGNATAIADTINSSNVTNVRASSTTDNRLIIQVVDSALTRYNEKLLISVVDQSTLDELGIQLYTETQIINCPHEAGATQFGSTIKFNEFDSVVIAAPVGTRWTSTTFDFDDDENNNDDTIFDNNATRFLESYTNAGAVYMFDLLTEYNESLTKPSAFVYAQSINATDQDYGNEPRYGTAIDFNNNVVMVGTPYFLPTLTDGQVVIYNNASGIKDWAPYRQSAPVVNIEKIQNTQLFSAETNNTLINLDYMDPLQGKLLGAVRENIDFISSVDPARYNSALSDVSGNKWGTEQIGKIWFNTANVRWVNYHQNDVVYNSKYWGALFPGSDVAVCTWVASFNPPDQYIGPGLPLDPAQYSISAILNATNSAVPVYCFWVRNTGIVFNQQGKTLADSVISSYIANPLSSGIAYMAPLLPNTFALYNSDSYINANDSVFHVGFGASAGNDVSHQEFTLIRENYPDDFLPGFPSFALSQLGEIISPLQAEAVQKNSIPKGLYSRMLDSLAGCDDAGSVVPNPYLPKAVQSGVLARPRQSFFYNRFAALNNYLGYANSVLAQFPIAEIRENASFLFASGEFYNTPDYWEYVNWWAEGYSNNTRSITQVPLNSDLVALCNVVDGTIVTVEQNGAGKFEVYRYDAATMSWTRIGLENGTIQFSTYLWDYSAAKLGFGGDFFDTTAFDLYPSQETYYIVRALNEQIYVDELVEYRNKSLILLFEYIQSETTESQNFLPWLNKTSLVDVSHTIRELRPIEVYQSDNQEFLEGYINEVKPYHVVIKEFLFKYTGIEEYAGAFTDFDLPAGWSSTNRKYISPQLVYGDTSSVYEFNTTSNLWATPDYNEWYTHYGVSLTGETDYEITELRSYVNLGSSYIAVDNAQGFPINGTIKIGDEQIGYSYVDRSLNIIGGLLRGLNNTLVSDHIPGEIVSIDLPAVLVLDGGRGYNNPPKVTAYIDLEKYPQPRTTAQLEAVMSLDSVIGINVIDPGDGYAVLPEIRIESASQISFNSTAINSELHTIQVYAPALRTGDIVQYKDGTLGGSVGRLLNDQWYYVNVLENFPVAVIALFSNVSDAIKNQNRIPIYANSIVSGMSINTGARASAISSAAPVRENNVTLRFDRTTYNSQVVDWSPGAYYGSFFAGSYFNSESIASSSITLDNENPSIDNILASAQGLALEISSVANDRQITWSSFVRYVGQTSSGDNYITLIPQDGNPVTIDPTLVPAAASGGTTGFYVGMPIKFTGATVGGLTDSQIYYVAEVVDEINFTVSATEGGSVFSLTSGTVSAAGLECYVADVTDTAVLTVNYPGILTATATTAGTNVITIPTSEIGTGGTAGFYPGIPLFFPDPTFGGITPNEIYYVTTIVDEQNITISTNQAALTLTVTGTVGISDTVVINDTANLAINDPIIFTSLTGTLVAAGLVSGKTYYVNRIVNSTEITLAEVINGPVVLLNTGSGTGLLTSQADTLQLTTDTGSMTMNVSLPASPGQINGQLFTLYNTSGQYPNLDTASITALIERSVQATIGDGTSAGVNRIAILDAEQGTSNFYVNMPVRFDTAVGGLSTATTYYVIDYSGRLVPDVLNPGNFITQPNIEVFVVSTSSSTNRMTVDTVDTPGTDTLYQGMMIVFSGAALGGVVSTREYYVKDIISQSQFTISDTLAGALDPLAPPVTLTTSNGLMVGTGDPYLVVSATLGGSAVNLTTDTTESRMVQFPNPSGSNPPSFDVSYILGGYRVIIADGSTGFAIDNVLTLSGASVGGTSPNNDLTLTVNTIDDDGSITDVIISGTVPGESNQYYLKVRSPYELEVYSNPLMTVPVSGIDFAYTGFTSTTVTETQAGPTSTITVNNASVFELYDAVVFTGTVAGGIVANQTYYIINISTNSIQLSTTPSGSAITLTTVLATNFTMAKTGSIALLPEPFYFSPSIVRFNNRVYVCAISNNDDTFVFGKWDLLDSGDRRLNAMDRVIGYYRPTVNMPGVDLTQLFEGVEYPNSTYLGNAFEPDQQWPLDTILQDQPFYPTDADITSILYHDDRYLASANLPTSSAIISNAFDEATWQVNRLTNAGVGVTDIIYADDYYVMTSSNPATPIFRSTDGELWSANGYFIPFGAISNTTTTLSSALLTLNSIAYYNNQWCAVGENIIVSADAYIWNQVSDFDPAYQYQLYGVSAVQLPAYSGFVTVGKGLRPDYTTGFTQIVPTNLILYSSTGLNWTAVSTLTNKGLYGISSNNTIAIAVGESGVIYGSANGADWLGINEVTVISVNASNNILNVTNTAGLSINDSVRFSASFSSILAGTTYYIKTIVSSTQVTLSDTSGGSTKTLTVGSPIDQTLMYIYDVTDPIPSTLRDVIYANNVWIAVGDDGTIKTAPNTGLIWTTQTSGTTENLNGIAYDSGALKFTIVGNNSTILESDDNGVTWTDVSVFAVTPAVYDVQGDAFLSGYGPEELVPGVVTDTLAMIVTTSPGTNWPVTEYAHTGYNVISIEVAPESATQTVYSFNNIVRYPVQVFVQILDATTMLGTTLAETEYTIDWINKSITLNTPIGFSPAMEKLRIDVYEVGNGNQLVKSNTDADPIRTNTVTGFDEIYLDCNYSAAIFNGGGIIRPDTNPIQVEVTASDSSNNRYTCASVTEFVVNAAITFTGVVFGGVAEDTVYYVKSISYATNAISISASYNPITGVAGPTLVLTTDTGTMQAIVQTGTGLVWTDPIVYLNGEKLVFGNTGQVTRTNASNNALTINSTYGFTAGLPITFSNSMFGGVIQPQTTYYIATVIDDNEFTISETSGGPILTLTNATGGAVWITNDYAFGIQPNSVQAVMIFATGDYDNSIDYIAYSVFGETEPDQYKYTVPEVQWFIGNGAAATFNLNNYVGDTNPYNAVVEINGVRQTLTQYTIDSDTNTILFYTPPIIGATISVQTYNSTDRQYFDTQYGVTGSPGSSSLSFTVGSTTHLVGTYDQDTPSIQSYDQDTPSIVSYDEDISLLTLSSGNTSSLQVNNAVTFTAPTIGGIVANQTYYIIEIINSTDFVISEQVGGQPFVVTTASGSMAMTSNGLTVAPIANIISTLSVPVATTYATATTTGTNQITVTSTTGFIVDQPVQFYGTGFGNILTDGTVYFVNTIGTGVFTIKDENGIVISLSNGTGNVLVVVGGQSTIRVKTSSRHRFVDNSRIRIDGTTGSVQLNNNIYYAKVIDSYTFDLYNTPYGSTIGYINDPVTTINAYTGGGYVWLAGLFNAVTTTASATTTSINRITVASTFGLVIGTPIYFSELGYLFGDTIMGGLVQGTEYYVKAVIDSTKFTISSIRGGVETVLSTDSGAMNVTQWSQSNVDRLWVTVNGLRVPSSKLRLNPANEISILTEITFGDEVIIGSMMPHSSPDQDVYINFVDQSEYPTVYRANDETRTWLVQPIYDLSTLIYVYDVSALTNTVVQNVTAPAVIDGYRNIGLTADKRSICSVTVLNNTTGLYIDSQYYSVEVEELSPILKIVPGSYINTGDSLTINTLEGNTIYVNGERIKFGSVNFDNNTLGNLQRGANGTGAQFYIPLYSEVYGLLSSNRLPEAYYNQTWNSYNWNVVEGDPLSISDTVSAQFLQVDIT